MAMAAPTREIVDFEEIQFCEKELGSGSYGVVREARWRNRQIAVKVFPHAESKHIKKEIAQLSRVSHRNIISLYGISMHGNATYLLMEYMAGGSLHKFLHGERQKEHTYWYALDWALQIAQGLAYLHGMEPKPLIHRDIKPDNILLSQERKVLKICDFGTVTDFASIMTVDRGTPLYMAPEVFKTRTYTEKCDVYSFGITLWEMMARQRPFVDLNSIYQVYMNVDRGERPSFDGNMDMCPKQMKDLITECWTEIPSNRPSMKSVACVLNDLLTRNLGI